eukprot:GHVH01005357.1.p1 GENE.GHVH01005357.1~~GHVH01005357.1.p1  ORF type:complete len:385 (+),score=43.39 GHVH01005357.1:53-1207(+)
MHLITSDDDTSVTTRKCSNRHHHHNRSASEDTVARHRDPSYRPPLEDDPFLLATTPASYQQLVRDRRLVSSRSDGILQLERQDRRLQGDRRYFDAVVRNRRSNARCPISTFTSSLPDPQSNNCRSDQRSIDHLTCGFKSPVCPPASDSVEALYSRILEAASHCHPYGFKIFNNGTQPSNMIFGSFMYDSRPMVISNHFSPSEIILDPMTGLPSSIQAPPYGYRAQTPILSVKEYSLTGLTPAKWIKSHPLPCTGGVRLRYCEERLRQLGIDQSRLSNITRIMTSDERHYGYGAPKLPAAFDCGYILAKTPIALKPLVPPHPGLPRSYPVTQTPFRESIGRVNRLAYDLINERLMLKTLPEPPNLVGNHLGNLLYEDQDQCVEGN